MIYRVCCCILILWNVNIAWGEETGLVGFWPLRGDSRDHSGREHHGIAHEVQLKTGDFNGVSSFVEIADHPDFHFGQGPFTVSANVQCDDDLTDIAGYMVSKFDPKLRRGFQFSISSSGAGYNGPSDTRYLQFGTDDSQTGRWQDCGRPGTTHSSDALTVFNGELYVGTCDSSEESDWAHVYRYRGNQDWEDCGRVGNARTRGVYAMVVHNGALYAATSASHGPQSGVDFGRVYRYQGGTKWEDIGQPGENFRLNALGSFRGKLYVCGFNIGPQRGFVYEYNEGGNWKECGQFEGWPHALTVHNGKLYTGYPQGEVFAFDGTAWSSLGNPLDTNCGMWPQSVGLAPWSCTLMGSWWQRSNLKLIFCK